MGILSSLADEFKEFKEAVGDLGCYFCMAEAMSLLSALGDTEKTLGTMGSSTLGKFTRMVDDAEIDLDQLTGDNWKEIAVSIRTIRELIEEELYFGGIHFDPLFNKAFMYPVLGMFVLALTETVVAPLTHITILSQMGRGGNRATTNYLWRETLVSVAHTLTFYGVSLYSYASLRSIIMTSTFCPAATVAFISGGLASLTATMIVHPLDTLRTHVVAQSQITGEEERVGACWTTFSSMASFYAGISASLLATIPSMATSLCVYEVVSYVLEDTRHKDSRILVTLASGCLAGLAASATTYPLQVVKRRMQLDGLIRRRRGVRKEIEEIVSEEGSGGLYKGIQPRMQHRRHKEEGGLVLITRGGGGICDTLVKIVKDEGVGGLYRGMGPHCFKTMATHTVALMSFEKFKVSFSFLAYLLHSAFVYPY